MMIKTQMTLKRTMDTDILFYPFTRIEFNKNSNYMTKHLSKTKKITKYCGDI